MEYSVELFSYGEVLGKYEVVDNKDLLYLVPVPNFPGYMAASDGHIYSMRTGKPIYEYVHKKHGRPMVTLHNNGTRIRKAVHCLITLSFHGPKPKKYYHASHLNDNPLDNRPDNLKWETPKQNMRRKYVK